MQYKYDDIKHQQRVIIFVMLLFVGVFGKEGRRKLGYFKLEGVCFNPFQKREEKGRKGKNKKKHKKRIPEKTILSQQNKRRQIRQNYEKQSNYAKITQQLQLISSILMVICNNKQDFVFSVPLTSRCNKGIYFAMIKNPSQSKYINIRIEISKYYPIQPQQLQITALYNIDKQTKEEIQQIIAMRIEEKPLLQKINRIAGVVGLEDEEEVRDQVQKIIQEQHKSNCQEEKQEIPRLNQVQDFFNTPYLLTGDLKQQYNFSQSSKSNQPVYELKSRYKKDFVQIQQIGEGGFGRVFKARNKLDQNIYAIKKVKLNINDNTIYQKTIRQVTLLSQLNHSNIVRYHQAWIQQPSSVQQIISDLNIQDQTQIQQMNQNIKQWNQKQVQNSQSDFIQFERSISQSKSGIVFEGDAFDQKEQKKLPYKILYIQMEYCSQFNLGDLVKKQISHQVKKLKIIRGFLSALVHIHSKKIIHRDIKPANAFLQGQDIKIGDFGLATTNIQEDRRQKKVYDQNQKTSRLGTSYYKAPQISQPFYDHKVDIFSLGVVLFQIYYPMKTRHQRDKVLTALTREGIFPKNFQQKCKDQDLYIYLKKMISHNPSQRPSAQQLLTKFRSQEFVALISSVTSNYQYRELLALIFKIKNKNNIFGNQSSLPVSQKLIVNLGLSNSFIAIKGVSYFYSNPVFLHFVIRNIQNIFATFGGLYFELPTIIPLREHIFFGTVNNRSMVITQRQNKRLYLNKQGVIGQQTSDLLSQWISFIKKYYVGQRRKQYIKHNNLGRIWNGKAYQLRASFSLTYSFQSKYLLGNIDQMNQLYQIFTLLKSIIIPQNKISITNILYLQLLCQKNSFPFDRFYKIFKDQRVVQIIRNYKNQGFANPQRICQELYSLFGLQKTVGFSLIQGISWTDQKPPFQILQQQPFCILVQWFNFIQQLCQDLDIQRQYDLTIIPDLACSGLYIWHPWCTVTTVHLTSQQIYLQHLQIKIGNLIYRYQQLNLHIENNINFKYVNYINPMKGIDIVVFMLHNYQFWEVFQLAMMLRGQGFRTEWARAAFPRDKFKNIPIGIQIKKRKHAKSFRIIDFQQNFQKQGQLDLISRYLQKKQQRKIKL